MVDTDKYRVIPFEQAEDAGAIADKYGGIVISDRHSRPATVLHEDTTGVEKYASSRLRGIELTQTVKAVADGKLSTPDE